jgi:hypothetical protein
MGSCTFDSEGEKEARTDLTHPPAVRPLTVDAATCTSNSTQSTPTARGYHASAGPLTRQRQRLAVGDILAQPWVAFSAQEIAALPPHGVGAALPSHVEGLPVLTPVGRRPCQPRLVGDRLCRLRGKGPRDTKQIPDHLPGEGMGGILLGVDRAKGASLPRATGRQLGPWAWVKGKLTCARRVQAWRVGSRSLPAGRQ